MIIFTKIHKSKRRFLIILVITFLFARCNNKNESNSSKTPSEDDKVMTAPLFTLMDASTTKLNFINLINESPTVNGIVYEYLYNGGGVAVGDLNNDNLPDIYFISNLYSNKLFINKGNLVFEETTLPSKVKGNKGFPTGVSMVDINSDGLLDIYICKSGNYPNPDDRKNELYVNQGNNAEGIPIFNEAAAHYRLDLPHYSTQASFFDYDRDGDLDMFLINHGIEPADIEPNIKKLLSNKSPYSSERLYRNDEGKFEDVSKESGIIDNAIGFGLGIAVGDMNNDGWPDILVGHDYSEKDHMYVNQTDGTFKEVIKKATNHISNFSMGNDIGDINNDGLLDFISLDMVSNNNYDLKTNMSGMDPNRFNDLVDVGLHHQYMFNALQLNNGHSSGTDIPQFSEIAKYAGIAHTNWSWAPLLFDMNNDGLQDLFVSNGIVRSFRNNDFVAYKRKRVEELYKTLEQSQHKDSLIKKYYEDLLAVMPEKKEINLLYLNNGDFTFSAMNEDWNLTTPTCTNGAAYADLDNDGDLDIIGNNINDAAFVYRNNSSELKPKKSSYIKIKLKGPKGNTVGIGSRVTIETDSVKQTKELYVSRGFQSSVSEILHFGLGSTPSIQKLSIVWPDGKSQILRGLNVNQQMTLNYNEATERNIEDAANEKKIFTTIGEIDIPFKHNENDFNDFERESLLPHKFSQNGPGLAVGDVNNDSLDDVYIGGAKNQAATLFIQQKEGTFRPASQLQWEGDKSHEDIAAEFFDADGDGDLDLYVVSGGNEEKEQDIYYRDRFYENTGEGKFVKSSIAIPDIRSSGSCVTAADFDNDGNLDLFVGGKMIPGKYPLPAGSVLLKNESREGKIKFVDVTSDLAPFMSDLGMVSDAEWVDIDNDNTLELLIVGEWMPIKVIKNVDGTFVDFTLKTGLEDQIGWWFSIESADFDKDGDTDFIVGNLGENYKYKASPQEPFEVYAKDFDSNGSLDIAFGFHEKGKIYPLRGRECSSIQMPFIKEKFPSYHDFGLADMPEVYGEENLDNALHYSANTFATSYVENLGNLKFKVHKIEGIAQFSSVNSILIDDFDTDGNLDALLSGNLYQSEIETPRNDAGYGVLLEGNGKGQFTSRFPNESGLYVKGDVKSSGVLNTARKNKKLIIFGKNNDAVKLVEY
jgi:hypothetical protein